MQAFLIDPEARTLEIIDIDGLESIQEAIRCDTITAARFNDTDVVYVDDEGLLKGPTSFFLIEGYPQPLAGRGVVVGTDAEGDDTPPTVTEEWLREHLDFGLPVKMGSNLMFVGDRHMRLIDA